ncbi:MAG: flagellar motor switch phosphatase FliY [Peptococcaceae bacterium]|nr:flagellar motor switch phosphatase FliY [Peptococcaceae bacterium]
MTNGMLSQEEIDALLSGPMESQASENSDEQKNNNPLTDMEIDALGEIANISMGTAATTLSQLVGKRVEITSPVVDITDTKQIIKDYPVPHVLIDVRYKRVLEGSNMLVLSREDGSVIVDLMMGGTGKNPSTELDEIHISGISEAMNQMMGSAATSMSTVFNSVIDITPPTVILSDVHDEESQLNKILNAKDNLVRISFKLTIEGILDSILLQVIPMPVAKDMVAKLMGGMSTTSPSSTSSGQASLQEPSESPTFPTSPTSSPSPEPSTPPTPPASSPSSMAPTPPTFSPSPTPPTPPMPQAPPAPPAPSGYNWESQTNNYMSSMPSSGQAFGSSNQKPQATYVEPAQFAQLTPEETSSMAHNLGLIADVPLQVNVELGKASKTIKEILELGPGSVVELDRLAGEPVDMFVNGKLIAKCEVVVINETFGIRITEIVSPANRIDTLN